jgi:5-methylcytosine-specific restriction protein A
MPIAPPVACYCGKLNCQTHNRHRIYDRERANNQNRKLYHTSKWRFRTRPRIFNRDPLCKIARICVEKFGDVAASTEVDHIIPFRGQGDFFDESNLQGACHDCHSWKTATENGFGGNIS